MRRHCEQHSFAQIHTITTTRARVATEFVAGPCSTAQAECRYEPNGGAEVKTFIEDTLLVVERSQELGCICNEVLHSGLAVREFRGVMGFLSQDDCGVLRYFARVRLLSILGKCFGCTVLPPF